MPSYHFAMSADESHAVVSVDANPIGTIQNVPDYLGGGLSFSSDSRHHTEHSTEGMWDEFDAWTDTLEQPA